jgi:hypothetical protein
MVLYAYCVLIVFSLCRESLNLILVDEHPILRWLCHILHVDHDLLHGLKHLSLHC